MTSFMFPLLRAHGCTLSRVSSYGSAVVLNFPLSPVDSLVFLRDRPVRVQSTQARYLQL